MFKATADGGRVKKGFAGQEEVVVPYASPGPSVLPIAPVLSVTQGRCSFGGSGLSCILRNREDALLSLIIRVGRAGFTLYPLFNSMRLVSTFFGEPGSLPPFPARVG